MYCSSGKISFETFSEAQRIINKANKSNTHSYKRGKRLNRQTNKRPKRVYKCDECGKYHLTSKLKR